MSASESPRLNGQQQQQQHTNNNNQDHDLNNNKRHEFSSSEWEKIKSEANRVSVSVGQNVVLNCAVQFKHQQQQQQLDGSISTATSSGGALNEKPFVVNWFKQPNSVPIYIWYAGYPTHITSQYASRVSRIGQALNLSRVEENDRGLYECNLHYPKNRLTSTEIKESSWTYLDVQGEFLYLFVSFNMRHLLDLNVIIHD